MNLCHTQKSLLELKVLLYSGSKPMNLSQSSEDEKNTALLNCLSLSRDSLRLAKGSAALNFRPLQVPGETIGAQVCWRQREPLKTWLFLRLWGAPTRPTSHHPPVWEKILCPTCFVPGAQLRQNCPFGQSSCLTSARSWFCLCEISAQHMVLKIKQTKETPGMGKRLLAPSGLKLSRVEQPPAVAEAELHPALRAVGVCKGQVGQQLPFCIAIVISALNSSLLAQEEGAADHETAARTSDEA